MITLHDLTLERFLLAELDPQELAQVEKALASDAALREKLEAMQKQNALFLSQHPYAKVLGISNNNSKKQKQSLFIGLGTFAAIAAVLLFTFKPFGINMLFEEQVQLKGDATKFLVHLKSGEQSRLVKSGESIPAGSQLQLQFLAPVNHFVFVYSCDSKGNTTQHWPETAQKAVRQAENALQTLPHSFELDDTPGAEVFYFVTGSKNFDVAKIMQKIALADAVSFESNTENLDIQPSLSVRKFLVRKGK